MTRRLSHTTIAFAVALLSLSPAVAQSSGTSVFGGGDKTPAVNSSRGINYGDDTSEWANDGECDDPRFSGQGMAVDLGVADVGRDASDCRNGVLEGRLFLRDWQAEMLSTNCAAIDFGTDDSEYANDGECDDPRFDGMGIAAMLLSTDRGRDASDCRHLCTFGQVWLRSE